MHSALISRIFTFRTDSLLSICVMAGTAAGSVVASNWSRSSSARSGRASTLARQRRSLPNQACSAALTLSARSINSISCGSFQPFL